ncbi:acyl-CoA/acyl-ACP dehydrogenase [Kineosporia sp. J2-2]|uniref:Dibenzothiophene monooxygenase n=1 Tax=Kineosporia corallincola TaxID=2835133 RepID=A0ABS5TG21_9ACTN|nr:acyl-CoA dehydrogenase family protein [Kineosporia corallincola]MBT0770040.1 acyl-CoA/acyl-ACP dehydrogenase [Kineosporia corallincola]
MSAAPGEFGGRGSRGAGMSAAPGEFGESAWGATASGLWPDTADLLPGPVLDTVRSGAVEADRSGRISAAGLAALRGASWPGLAIPTEFGGAGAGVLRCCAAQRRLAAADPALAVAVNMHLFSTGLMVEQWRRRADVSWMLLEAVATQNRLVASAFAEPSLGGSVVRSTLRARRGPRGWVLSGRKSPCSLAADADLACLQAQSHPDDGPERLLVILLPTTADGVSVDRTWNTLGMRGSGSDTLRLQDCEVPDDLVFYTGPVGQDDDVVAAGVIWFVLTSTACYLGVLDAALALVRTLTARGRIAHLDASRAELPSVQAVAGEHLARVLTLESACAATASAMDAGADPERLLPAVLGLKQHAAEVLPAAIGALAEVCGGVSLSRAAGLERLWRDMQAIRFHPPTGLATRQFLGRRGLGLPAGLDLDETAPGLRALTAASSIDSPTQSPTEPTTEPSPTTLSRSS